MSQRNAAIGVVLVMLLGTLLATLYMGAPKVDDSPPLSLVLPHIAGYWHGATPLYCQQESCMDMTLDDGTTPIPEVCPTCGSALEPTALPERRILPEGTRLAKMIYRYAGMSAAVTVVLTGHERSGIHRPEWCLPSQGLSIQRSWTASCPMGSDHSLPLRMLEVAPKGRSTGGGLFAYWFADSQRETATHWQRLFWMAYNDLFLGVRRPWAYVSIWMPGATDKDAEARLVNFVQTLYPFLLVSPATTTDAAKEGKDADVSELQDHSDSID